MRSPGHPLVWLALIAAAATGAFGIFQESNTPLTAAALRKAEPRQSVIVTGYRRALADMAANFWDPAGNPSSGGLPRIQPTEGGGGPRNGLVVASSRVPTFWQMAQYANVLYGAWRLDRDLDAAEKIGANWRYVQRIASARDLAGDGAADHSVNISDDAGWKANYLAQVHEVTGDPAALTALSEMVPATLDRFAVPDQPQRTFGKSPAGRPIIAGENGILYAAANDQGAIATYCFCSSLFEATLANAALYAFSKSGNPGYRDYALATWDWIHARLRTIKENGKDTATGVYLTELILPRGASDGSEPAARNRFWGKPIRGLSAEYSGGTLAMAVLSARLYRLTGEPRYLAEARSIIAAFAKPDAFGRTSAGQALLVNERDPWTDGYWYPATVTEVLSLPGVDAGGTFKTALSNTGGAILAARTARGFYGADWSGPELNFTDGTRTWPETARRANGGTGGGQATPEQIMTSANSVAVVQAAYASGR